MPRGHYERAETSSDSRDLQLEPCVFSGGPAGRAFAEAEGQCVALKLGEECDVSCSRPAREGRSRRSFLLLTCGGIALGCVALLGLLDRQQAGARAGSASWLPAALLRWWESTPGDECPGSLLIEGYGRVALVNAHFNESGQSAAGVEVLDGQSVLPHMKGRTYFAEACMEGQFDHNQYVAIKFLGQTMQYSVDISSAKCGCNVALYLTSMHQNADISTCDDYYCDANRICGVNCAEIDIQEANQFAWYSTMHTAFDVAGHGAGFGSSHRDWEQGSYGPGGLCVDTNNFFQVAVSFPVDESVMEVKLHQHDRPCELSPLRVAYHKKLTLSLEQGMTPVISYWGVGENMSWFDGDGGEPCEQETPLLCGDSVRMWDFRVGPIGSMDFAQ